MLNIPEPVPPPESIPPDSGIPGIQSRCNCKQFRPIPELQYFTCTPSYHMSTIDPILERNSGIGIAGNWKELPGIPRNSVQFRPIPELQYLTCTPSYHTSIIDPIPERNSGIGIAGNRKEFRPIPSDSGIAVPYMYTKLSHVYNRSDSGFIQFRNSRPESDHH
jgi:hypothetical protein